MYLDLRYVCFRWCLNCEVYHPPQAVVMTWGSSRGSPKPCDLAPIGEPWKEAPGRDWLGSFGAIWALSQQKKSFVLSAVTERQRSWFTSERKTEAGGVGKPKPGASSIQKDISSISPALSPVCSETAYQVWSWFQLCALYVGHDTVGTGKGGKFIFCCLEIFRSFIGGLLLFNCRDAFCWFSLVPGTLVSLHPWFVRLQIHIS